jgi:hypothetical protein
MQELGLATIGHIVYSPFFEDDDSRMKNKLPSHLAILRGDERSSSNPKCKV